jgi:hypothetical protein
MKCARKFVYVLQCAANQKSLRTTALDCPYAVLQLLAFGQHVCSLQTALMMSLVRGRASSQSGRREATKPANRSGATARRNIPVASNRSSIGGNSARAPGTHRPQRCVQTRHSGEDIRRDCSSNSGQTREPSTRASAQQKQHRWWRVDPSNHSAVKWRPWGQRRQKMNDSPSLWTLSAGWSWEIKGPPWAYRHVWLLFSSERRNPNGDQPQVSSWTSHSTMHCNCVPF